MAQFNFANIDPATTSGTMLAALLNLWREAVKTNHSGPTRPGYAVQGMIWEKDTGGDTIELYIFDGDADLLIGTVTRSTNTLTLATVVPTLDALGAAAVARKIEGAKSITGGGNLSSDRILELVNDSATPGVNKVYRTDADGVRGWGNFPVTPAGQPGIAAFGPGASTNWTVPANVTKVSGIAYAGCGGTNTDDPGSFGAPGVGAEFIANVTPGASIAVNVGNVGTGGVPGNRGGTTSFGGFVSITGGLGAAQGGAPSAAAFGSGVAGSLTPPLLVAFDDPTRFMGREGKGGILLLKWWA